MRIQQNITVYTGDTQSGAQTENVQEKNSSADKSRSQTIYAGNLMENLTLQERIQRKKEQAQAQALKIVNEAWDVDKEVDGEIGKSKDHIEELQADYREAQEKLSQILEEREKLGENVLADADSEEQQALSDMEQRYRETADKAKQGIETENAVIRGIRGERRKHHPMADAQREAKEVLEAARDEIIGMVVQEAKDYVDGEQEKREETSEAIKEKKEEQEEILEKREEREEEFEELMEDLPLEEAVDLENVQDEIRQEIQNIMSKMGLAAEDIKGAKVDTSV